MADMRVACHRRAKHGQERLAVTREEQETHIPLELRAPEPPGGHVSKHMSAGTSSLEDRCPCCKRKEPSSS